MPNRPTVNLKIVKEEPTVSVDVAWSRPTQTYGELLGYRLRYGPKDDEMTEIFLDGAQIQHRLIEELERGLEYEFRIAGKNRIGFGQEAVRTLPTPEGAPSGDPCLILLPFKKKK